MSIHNQKKPSKGAGTGSYWLHGVHAVTAAMANPRRKIRRLLATRNTLAKLEASLDASRHPKPEVVDPKVLDKQLPPGTVHQGMAAEVTAIEAPTLSEILEDIEAAGTKRPLVMLDQVTDPHNVGAILRTAAAFNAAAVVVTANHAPDEGAVIAKAACGALEIVPLVPVVNLSQAIEEVKKAGYWVAGLDGAASQSIRETKLGADTALVLGAEGKGLRRLTGERCDLLIRLPIAPQMESLNVSNAAAVALYELYTRA